MYKRRIDEFGGGILKTILLLSMLFCHIVADFYLQGILAKMKQKSWWKENAPQSLYKYDYMIALIEHAFSWTFMIHVPIIIVYKEVVLLWFIVNVFIHAVVDNAKANRLSMSLVQDQFIHILQVVVLWLIYILVWRY